jgi:predicted nucleic acid-binding OB-fold protein
MKRKISFYTSEEIEPRTKKYKYTKDNIVLSQGVPFHYLVDRLATDNQINDLMNKLHLRKTIFDGMNEESALLYSTLSHECKIDLQSLVYDLIDSGYSRFDIYEDIEYYLDEL